MATHKHIDKICIAVTVFTLLLTFLFMNGKSLGIECAGRVMGYEERLFDTAVVHEIGIEMENWEEFIENCENEEYSSCEVIIDGDSCKNAGIRAKGNTSLSQVSQMDSERYSFKLEFDHYESGKSYYGLDKLCLNNLIQDNTMMKDYLVYQMMADFGVDAPLCSFAYITVNGEDWGLYLAVEGIEDSFLKRSYGASGGALYKPDSMDFGGGRGNGRDFHMDGLAFGSPASRETDDGESMPEEALSKGPVDGSMPEDGDMPDREVGQKAGDMPEGKPPEEPGDEGIPEDGDMPDREMRQKGGNGPEAGTQKPGGGMGSDDVKLKYIDDDPDSYPNIFENAKTDISEADQERLIRALKNLRDNIELEDTVDMEEVLRYFVVHNFVCNGDSYTGSMIHNYYLYEKDGKLSMIPWDYNLAFGTFQGNSAAEAVNLSIDDPVSEGTVEDRPMLGWIFSDEAYTKEYHALFAAFVEQWSGDGRLVEMISDTAELIAPYVEKDPTRFCTAAEFDVGVETLKQFVSLRAEAVVSQLARNDTNVSADGLNLSDMGTMENVPVQPRKH